MTDHGGARGKDAAEKVLGTINLDSQAIVFRRRRDGRHEVIRVPIAVDDGRTSVDTSKEQAPA